MQREYFQSVKKWPHRQGMHATGRPSPTTGTFGLARIPAHGNGRICAWVYCKK